MARTNATRQSINNLVRNGDFEFAPEFTAATTGNDCWIDGTASGSLINSTYTWAKFTGGTAGSQAARFDSTEAHTSGQSMKISTTAVGSAIAVSSGLSVSNKSVPISILPSTSYTGTAWIKTTANSGSATTGAKVRFTERNAANTTSLVNNFVGAITTTTPWTFYTVTFTTSATSYFILPILEVVGNDGTGTLVMDAWFDDITLSPTTPIVRDVV
jgi:hypothetical protein